MSSAADPLPANPPFKTPRLRLFVAVHLLQEQLDQLRSFQQMLKTAIALPALRWCAPDQLHLTLKFLGYVELSRVSALQDSLRSAAHGVPPFELHVRGAGGFPNLSRPRVLWAGIQSSPDLLMELQKRVEIATADFAQKDDARPFHPHLTLARLKEPTRLPAAARQLLESTQAICSRPSPVREFSLMKSTLSPSGAVYNSLASFPLLSDPA